MYLFPWRYHYECVIFLVFLVFICEHKDLLHPKFCKVLFHSLISRNLLTCACYKLELCGCEYKGTLREIQGAIPGEQTLLKYSDTYANVLCKFVLGYQKCTHRIWALDGLGQNVRNPRKPLLKELWTEGFLKESAGSGTEEWPCCTSLGCHFKRVLDIHLIVWGDLDLWESSLILFVLKCYTGCMLIVSVALKSQAEENINCVWSQKIDRTLSANKVSVFVE